MGQVDEQVRDTGFQKQAGNDLWKYWQDHGKRIILSQVRGELRKFQVLAEASTQPSEGGHKYTHLYFNSKDRPGIPTLALRAVVALDEACVRFFIFLFFMQFLTFFPMRWLTLIQC